MQSVGVSLLERPGAARQDSGPDQRATLISQYIGLVHKIAAQMAFSGTSVLGRDDLVGCGTLGLIEAADRYDHERSIGFAAYACHRIRGAMLDAARRADPLPRSIRRRVKQLDRANGVLAPSLGRDPSRKELCSAAGLTEDQYRETMTVASRVAIPLEIVVGNGDSERDQSVLQQPTEPSTDDFTGHIERRELIHDLGAAISQLPERDQLVLSLSFEEGLGLGAIAAVLEVSATRVSQLKARALARLRVALRWHMAA